MISTRIYRSLDGIINNNDLIGMKTIMAASHKLSNLSWTNVHSAQDVNGLNEEYRLVSIQHSFTISTFSVANNPRHTTKKSSLQNLSKL